MSAPALPRLAAPARPARTAPPTRDYAITGHDHWRTCGCSYHQALRVEPIEPDDPDNLYDPED